MSGVVLIGNFDGVHRGHQHLLQLAASHAPGSSVTAVTFWPHPMQVIRPDLAPDLLVSLPERVELLKSHGADEVSVVHFSEQLALLPPEAFVAEHLAPLDPSLIVVGENFRFGHRAAGDVETLARIGEGSFEVRGVGLLDVGPSVVSSTAIREALGRGDVATAGDLLGRPYSHRGTVVRGKQRGRAVLGMPTANLPVPRGRSVPMDGIYAGWTRRLDVPGALRWPSAISVGVNPTFDDVESRVVESHVLDRDDLQLYDVEVAVEFTHRLRGMVKFDGLEGLRNQMAADVRLARSLLMA